MSDAPSILDIVEDELCNPDDVCHAVLPTGRDGTTVFLLVCREQQGREGRLLHLRYATVDLADGSPAWSETGMVLRATEGLIDALPQALARTSSAMSGSVDVGAAGPHIDSAGYQGDAETLLTSPLSSAGSDDSDDDCVECGEPISSDDEVVELTLGGQTMVRHKGECSDG